MARNDESIVFSKIVRYIAQQAEETTGEQGDGEIGRMSAVLHEIADAFEQTGGFEYEPTQAEHLAPTFDMLAAAMQGLSQQAGQLNQHNAAAKMQWAATQASEMATEVRARFDEGAGGVIAFVDGTETETEPETEIE